jgi:uncharacterized protein YktA (UPF0223 family)
MKKFSAFLMESSLFKIFIVMWLISSIYSFALFSIMDSKFSMLVNLKIGLSLGIFISILSISIISISRDRIKFLNFFEKVEKMIEDAESREDLVKIYDKEFQDLLDLAKSREDIEKANFIYRILKIKYEYVEK